MKRIAIERERLGLTQRQVSDKVGIGYSSIFKIEQGVLVPGKWSNTALLLERFYGRKLRTLLKDA
jgi:transcriptional regulator with XRE-family HTH domain